MMAAISKDVMRTLLILSKTCSLSSIFIIPAKYREMFVNSESEHGEYSEDFRPAGLVFLDYRTPVISPFDLHGFLYRFHRLASFQDVDEISVLQLEIIGESR
jgi:hypothetical protein